MEGNWLKLALGLGLFSAVGGCMSIQRGLNPAERRVEQVLNAYVQAKAGCSKMWYQRWLPWLSERQCETTVTFYTGIDDRSGRPMDDDSMGNSFVIHVSEHNGRLCRRDSNEIKREARFFARQVRPLLLSALKYQWVEVEYSSCPYSVGGDKLSCQEDCQKVVQLALQDTSNWLNPTLYPSSESYYTHFMLTHKSVPQF